MIDKTTLLKIEDLSEQYKKNWNKELDLIALPSGIDTTQLLKILARITKTGESVLVGYEKLFLR